MHTPQPLPPPKGSLSKYESGASEPQPTSSCPGRHPLPRRLQVLPRHTPRLAPSESRSDTFRDPAVHTPPAGGVWGLEPQTQDQVLPLAPTPRHPGAGPLPRPSCLLPGQLLTCLAVSGAARPWPPGGVPSLRPASHPEALPHWPVPALLCPHGGARPGRDGAGRGSSAAAHNLPSRASEAGGCLQAVLCRSRPGRHSSGLPRVRPQAVCSSLI